MEPVGDEQELRTVWLAFRGEYDQRTCFGVFATRELAKASSDDIEEKQLLDRPFRCERHWTKQVEVDMFGATATHDLWREDDWSEYRSGWGQPVSRATVHQCGAQWIVTVERNDEQAVNAELARLVGETIPIAMAAETDQ